MCIGVSKFKLNYEHYRSQLLDFWYFDTGTLKDPHYATWVEKTFNCSLMYSKYNRIIPKWIGFANKGDLIMFLLRIG